MRIFGFSIFESKQTTGPDPVEIQRQVNDLKRQLDIAESLLVGGPDPDAALVGTQSHSLFRQVSSGGKTIDYGRDLDKAKRDHVLKMSHNVYALRGDGYNILEIFVDFICGYEFEPVTEDPKNTKLQELLDEVWESTSACLEYQHENLIRTCLLEGEIFMPVLVNPTNGIASVGWTPPEFVEEVILDYKAMPLELSIRNPREAGGELLHYFVLNQYHDKMKMEIFGTKYTITDESNPENPISRTFDGVAFFKMTNAPLGATRGRSELLQILDYVDIHDELIWSDVEREKLLKMFIVDVTFTDARSKADIDKKLQDMGLTSAPKGPRVLAHNKNAEVQLLGLTRSASDSEGRLETMLTKNIYGGKGFPEHWSGSGADTSLGTAKAQDYVPLRRLRRKQREFIHLFKQMVHVMMLLRSQMGSVDMPEEETWDMNTLEVGGKDRQRGAVVLKDIVVATSQAINDGTLRREAGHEIVLQAIREGGFDVSDKNADAPSDEELNKSMLQKLDTQIASKSKAGNMTKDRKGSDKDGSWSRGGTGGDEGRSGNA